MPPRLIVFDVDGTLTDTDAVDTRCYVRAMCEHLGHPIDSDWSRYRHVTDSGIAAELLERDGRPVEEMSAVRNRFVALLEEAFRTTPGCCREVRGAGRFLQRVRQTPDLIVGLATGGWNASARAKLRSAGIDAGGRPFASADDAQARTDIMKTCRDRAGTLFTDITYVGDGVWDARAAADLGWRFVGIAAGERAARLREAGAVAVFADFSDPDGVLAAL